MASPTTLRSPYLLRVELVRDTITSHTKLGGKEASELAEHVLDALNSIPEKVRQRLLDQIPLKRFGKAEEVARAVIYLVSPDGDYITGEELSLNGGLLMR